MAVSGWDLHPLSRDMGGLRSVSVSGNWQIVLAFESGDAILTDDLDYQWTV
jgi:toxin HigB-1